MSYWPLLDKIAAFVGYTLCLVAGLAIIAVFFWLVMESIWRMWRRTIDFAKLVNCYYSLRRMTTRATLAENLLRGVMNCEDGAVQSAREYLENTDLETGYRKSPLTRTEGV